MASNAFVHTKCENHPFPLRRKWVVSCLLGGFPTPPKRRKICGYAIRGITQNNVTLLMPILGFDKKSYYPLKIAGKSCCAAVLFWVKDVTMSTNRSPFWAGVLSYHYLNHFRTKNRWYDCSFLPRFLYVPNSLDSILSQ